MSTITQPRPAVKSSRKPLTVELTIAINGVAYSVTPIGNAPGGAKSFRLAKVGGDGAVYDVDAFADRIECSCPSYQKTHAGTSSLCKHSRALVMVGLADYPNASASEPEVEAPSTPEAPAFDLGWHRAMNAVVEKRATWLSERPLEAACCDDQEPEPCKACRTFEGPSDLSDADWMDEFRWELGPDTHPDKPVPHSGFEDDPEVLELIENGALEQAEGEAPLAHATPECFAAIAEGRAEPMREFGLVPYTDWLTPENRDDLEAEDAILAGWACHRDRDFQASQRARSAALLAAEDALIASRRPEPEPRTLAEQVDDHARELRAIGSPLHDLLAERAEQLAAEVRYLDASTVEQYRDRREAALDAARDAAEARMAARCC